MTKEKVIRVLSENGYKCEIIDNVPTVFVSDFEEETISSVKRLIPDYHNSLGFRKPQPNQDQKEEVEHHKVH